MSLTTDDLKTEIAVDLRYSTMTAKQWEDSTCAKQINYRTGEQISALMDQYVVSIDSIRLQLRSEGLVATVVPCNADGTNKTVEQIAKEITERRDSLQAKEKWLMEKFACCSKELELRDKGDVIREIK